MLAAGVPQRNCLGRCGYCYRYSTCSRYDSLSFSALRYTNTSTVCFYSCTPHLVGSSSSRSAHCLYASLALLCACYMIATCSNMGICDASTGRCSCRPGYEGAACERMTCPGGGNCNGHGNYHVYNDHSVPWTHSLFLLAFTMTNCVMQGAQGTHVQKLFIINQVNFTNSVLHLMRVMFPSHRDGSSTQTGKCVSMAKAASEYDGYRLNGTSTYNTLWDAKSIHGCVCDRCDICNMWTQCAVLWILRRASCKQRYEWSLTARCYAQPNCTSAQVV
jgi:hypothetical protein